MKSNLWPPVLCMLSIISVLLVINATYPWELAFVFVPIICLIAFYKWLDDHNL